MGIAKLAGALITEVVPEVAQRSAYEAADDLAKAAAKKQADDLAKAAAKAPKPKPKPKPKVKTTPPITPSEVKKADQIMDYEKAYKPMDYKTYGPAEDKAVKKAWLDKGNELFRAGRTNKEAMEEIGVLVNERGFQTTLNERTPRIKGVRQEGQRELFGADQEIKYKKDQDRAQRIAYQSTGVDGVRVPKHDSVENAAKLGKVKGDKKEIHHWNSIIDKAPAYKGLEQEEARELTTMIRDYGWANGDDFENLLLMIKDDHHEIHNWLRAQNIERSGTKAKSAENLFEGLTVLERFNLLKRFMVFNQGAADSQLMKMGYNPTKAHKATQLKAIKEVHDEWDSLPDDAVLKGLSQIAGN